MSKRQKSSEGQDYISNLPDFIIGHILSFLTTTDAVRTSVLSKRWKYMWTFVTILDFCDRENCYRESSYEASNERIKQFSNFVSRVLFHINSASIENFELYIGENYDAYINEWLCAVLNKGVKNIHVFNYGLDSKLSCYPLFQSPSLETLVLQMMAPCIIKVPAFVCLPSLTVLDLKEIKFTHYSSVKLKELTLKLPLLRVYRTTSCTWSGVKSVKLEAPLLEEVIFEEVMKYYSITRARRKSRTEIKFCASHLPKFVYHGDISSLPETILVDGHIASVAIFLHKLKDTSVEKTWVSLRKLLSQTNTECLALHFDRLQCCPRVGRHFVSNTFGMLGHMRLNFVTGEVLLSLLLKSPCLKTLVLQMDDFAEETHNFAIVPDCFLSTLKVVKIEYFSGRECELSFAKFVMENARVLERINFSFHWKLPISEVEKAKVKLFSFGKSFSTVIMEFSTHGDKVTRDF